MTTDTWGQLVSTTLSHKICINTSRLLPSCSFAVQFRKAFQQETMGQHYVGPKISFTDEMFGSNLFLSDRTIDSRFCDCEDE